MPKMSFRARLQMEIREVVFGIEDSLVSTLGVITGVASGTANRSVVILSGIVVIFVESVSMAAGTFLSSESKQEAEKDALRKAWQHLKQHRPEALRAVRLAYKKRGFGAREITVLMKRVSKNNRLLLEELNAHGLHLELPSKEQPRMNALYMGVTYLVAGIIPIGPYLLLPVETALWLSVILTVLALFFVGVGKARLVNRSPIRSGIEMTTISLSAAVLGYVIGKVLGGYFDLAT
ncbi:MAG: VIT1/CCC1 transporter family protein [Patescibacteria group bacterium]